MAPLPWDHLHFTKKRNCASKKLSSGASTGRTIAAPTAARMQAFTNLKTPLPPFGPIIFSWARPVFAAPNRWLRNDRRPARGL
jgi:hypothetical protein